jgi:hypothetical protein
MRNQLNVGYEYFGKNKNNCIDVDQYDNILSRFQIIPDIELQSDGIIRTL